MKQKMFSGVSNKNVLLTIYTIMVFALIIYLSLLYNTANAIMTTERFTVQAVYSVGISLLVAMTGALWLTVGKEK